MTSVSDIIQNCALIGSSLVFEAADVLERIEQQGDLFAPVLELQQELPEL